MESPDASRAAPSSAPAVAAGGMPPPSAFALRLRLGHSQSPVVTDLASAESGYRFRNWVMYVVSRRAIPGLALDAHAEEKRFRRGRRLRGEELHVSARFVQASGAVREQGEPVRGRRVVRRSRQRAPVVRLRVRDVAELGAAAPGVDEGDLGCLVQRVAQRHLELGNRLARLAVAAQVPAPVVPDVGVVRREREAALEVLLGLRVLAQHRIDEAEVVVDLRVAGVERHCLVELLERNVHPATLVIPRAEFGMEHCAILRARFLGLHRRQRIGRALRGRSARRR